MATEAPLFSIFPRVNLRFIKRRMMRLTYSGIFLATALTAALTFSSCSGTDGAKGAAGADGSSCAATAVKDTSGKVLGYALACGADTADMTLDTLWNGTGCAAEALVKDKDTTGYALVCAGDTVGMIADGNDGTDGADGESCTASRLTDGTGYTLTCGDSSFTVLNGTDGKAGAAGESCTASRLTDGTGYTLTCGDSSFTVLNGKNGTDGAGCTATSAGDSIVQICGTDTLVIYKAWCGASHYDPAEQFCVGVTLYDLCGGKSYDLAKQYCLATGIDTSVQAFLTDARDKQVYKTVKIGTQTWMAQNLNYAVDSSWCYGNSADSCAKYGRLYTWTAAMGVDTSHNSVFLGDSVNHQGACPAGWHVPTNGEWATLETAVGGSDTAGTELKSTTGWTNGGNGTGDFGFSALPAGNRDEVGNFNDAGGDANFWSATEIDAYSAHFRNMDYHNRNMDAGGDGKGYAFSVRCVQN